jgi:chromosome segregation ATPase
MAEGQIKGSDLFKGGPEKVFEGYIKGAKDAEDQTKLLIDVTKMYSQALEKVGKSGEEFAKTFDKSNAKDIALIDKRVEELNKSLEEQNKVIKDQQKLIDQLNKAKTTTTKKLTEEEKLTERLRKVKAGELDTTIKLRAEITKETAERRRNAKESLEQDNAFKVLEQTYRKQQANVKRLSAEFLKGRKELGLTRKEYRNLRKELRKAEKEFKDTAEAYEEISKKAKDGRPFVGRYSEAIKDAGKNFTNTVAKAGVLAAVLSTVVNASVGKSREGLRGLNTTLEQFASTISILANRGFQALKIAFFEARNFIDELKLSIKESIPGPFRSKEAQKEINDLKNKISEANEEIKTAKESLLDLSGTLDEISESNSGISRLREQVDRTSDTIASLSIEIEKLVSQEEILEGKTGDGTIPLVEQRKALDELIDTQNRRLGLQRQIATEELKIASERLNINLNQVEGFDLLTGSQKEAIVTLENLTQVNDDNLESVKKASDDLATVFSNFKLADSVSQETLDSLAQSLLDFENVNNEVTKNLKKNAQIERQILQDRVEQNLDILIDIFDRQKTATEKVIEDERVTFSKRKELFDQLTKDIRQSLDLQVAELQKLTRTTIDVDRLLNIKDLRVLNKELQSLGLSEIAINRFREIILEFKAFNIEANDLGKELKLVNKELQELGGEIIFDEEQLEKLRSFALERAISVRDLLQGRDISELTSKELDELEKLQKDFNKRRADLENQSSQDNLEREIENLNKRISVAEEGSEEIINLILERNKKIKELEDAQLDDQINREKELTEKRKAELEKRREDTEEFLEKVSEIIRGISEAVDEEANKRLQAIDDQINATDQKINDLKEQAQLGDEVLEQNLARESKRRAELARERQETEENLARIQAVLSIFESFSANLGANPDNPGKALADTVIQAEVIKQLAKGIVGGFFHEGSEDIGMTDNPLDGLGGMLAMLHSNERVMDRHNNNKTIKKNGEKMSNDEMAQLAYDKIHGNLDKYMTKEVPVINASWQTNKEILDKFDKLEKATLSLPKNMPKYKTDYNAINGIIKDHIEYNGKIETRVKSSKSLAFKRNIK